MKKLFKMVVFAGILVWLATNVGVAQELTQAQLDAAEKHFLDVAKKQFELAYKAECGKLPSPQATTSAMTQYKAVIGSIAKNLGQRTGKQALRLVKLRRGLDNLNGPELIGVLDKTRHESLAGFGFEKSKVVKLAQLEMPTNQMDGRLLVIDPNFILKLKENTELIFPEGTYSLDEQQIARILEKAEKKFPKGIAFVGAGKDKTTLKVTDSGFTRNDVDRLCFRKMTIDCDNDGLFDKRRGCLALRLDNVRLVRFDAGHGGCRLFLVNDGLIVHATDTEFVGGLGSSPGHGAIFDSCDIFLGYFERCAFTGVDGSLFRPIRGRSACLWMDECSFDRKHETPTCVEMNDCKFDVKAPVIKWSPKEDTEIIELKG